MSPLERGRCCLGLGTGSGAGGDAAVGSSRGWVLGAGSVSRGALTRAGQRAPDGEAGPTQSGFDFAVAGVVPAGERSLVFLLAQLPTSASVFSA